MSVLPAKPRRSRWRELLYKLLIFAVTSLICLLLLEWIVRVALPYYHPGRQTPLHLSEEGLMLGLPSQAFRLKTPKGDYDVEVSFNRYGLRDTKDLKDSTSNDVFVAGDSFSTGYCVEESERFSNLMEKQLGIRIYNVAIPEDIRGYIATVNYAKRHGANIHHLIIGVCMENDLWDYSKAGASVQRTPAKPEPMRAVRIWFKTHSALWICASYSIQRVRPGRVLFEKMGIADDIEAHTHKNEYSPTILASTRDELLKLATNYHSVVLIIPSRGLWYGKNADVEKKIHDEFVRLLREAGLNIVDMRPSFEKSGKPLQFYFATDPHWNTAGHREAATELARYLREQPDWQTVLAQRSGP